MTIRRRPRAEDGLADAHHGGPFFDGDFKVARHAHRQLVQANARRGLPAQLVAQVVDAATAGI